MEGEQGVGVGVGVLMAPALLWMLSSMVSHS